MRFCELCRYLAAVLQYFALGELEEGVEPLGLVFQGHGNPALRALLGQVQVGVDDASERFEFALFEVVLRHDDVGLQNLAVWCLLPGGQTHMRLSTVGALHDQLGRRVAVDSVVRLVLDLGE